MGGIPESSPIQSDAGGNGGQSLFGAPRARAEEPEHAPAASLLRGSDEFRASAPDMGAMGVVQACVLDGIAEALGVPRRASLAPRAWDLARDPRGRAEQIAAEASQLLQRAIASGRADAGTALVTGAQAGMQQAVEVIERIGHLDGPGGVAVASLFEAWGDQLARLVGAFDHDHIDEVLERLRRRPNSGPPREDS